MIPIALLAVKPALIPAGITEYCYGDLKAIDVAKQYWALENNKPAGSSVEWSDLVPKYMPETPRCSKGGTYTLGRIGELPACSVKDNPWHQRHYFLNYSDERFIVGRRVRFIGETKNTITGPFVGNGQEAFRVIGPGRWPLFDRDRKVTVFGVLSDGPPYAIAHASFQRGYFTPSSGEACLARLKQVEGAKSSWALEFRAPLDAAVTMSEMFQTNYFRSLLSCSDGAGIYIPEKLNERPRCRLHGDLLARDR